MKRIKVGGSKPRKDRNRKRGGVSEEKNALRKSVVRKPGDDDSFDCFKNNFSDLESANSFILLNRLAVFEYPKEEKKLDLHLARICAQSKVKFSEF